MRIEDSNVNSKQYKEDMDYLHNRIDKLKDEVDGLDDKLGDKFYELKMSNNSLHTKLDTVVYNAQKSEERAGRQVDRAQGQSWALVLMVLTIIAGAFINAFVL
ncbi:hypothetical protein ACFOU0_06630 [Salinicoccus sesuvii]|uniref:Uncharacterized protein n=1 Tax=Salinicoccus sesuvii TaxID=868281 RepID=A0ABV7N3S1_9STAP